MENRTGKCSQMLEACGKPQLAAIEDSYENFLEIPINMWMRKHEK